jgi:hypothetical protein
MDIPSRKQLFFRDMVMGTLLYAVVLGLFNDYTEVIHIESFSFIVVTAFVLQLLTSATFAIKRRIVSRFKAGKGNERPALLIGIIWMLMFGSKFVFLAAIEIMLGHAVTVSGAFGLMAIILIMETTKYAINRISSLLA